MEGQFDRVFDGVFDERFNDLPGSFGYPVEDESALEGYGEAHGEESVTVFDSMAGCLAERSDDHGFNARSILDDCKRRVAGMVVRIIFGAAVVGEPPCSEN